MTVIPLTCPRCAGLIQVEIADSGQQVACPECHSFIWVPPPDRVEPSPVPPPVVSGDADIEPPPVEFLALTCPACGGLFQVAATLAGSRVACPNCRALVMAAAAEPVELLPPAPRIAPTGPAVPPRPANSSAADSVPVEQANKARAHRRRTRNLILWIICLAILIAVLWLFL